MVVGLVGGLTVLPGCLVRDAVDATREGIVDAPSAKVVGVEVVEQTDQGVALDVTVELTNPNQVQLEIDGVSVDVAVSDIGRFSAEAPPMVTMPPAGMQRMTVRAAVPTRGKDVSGQTVTVGTSVRWIPPGEVRAILTESGVPLPFVLANYEGVLGQ